MEFAELGELLSSWIKNSPPRAERCGGYPLLALAYRAGVEVRAVIDFAVGAGQPVTRALVPGRLNFASCLRLRVQPRLHHTHSVHLRSKFGHLGVTDCGLCDGHKAVNPLKQDELAARLRSIR